MDWLKKLLEKHGVGDELVTTIMTDTKDANYIPKDRFDEVNNQVKDLKTQIDDRDKQLKDISKKAEGNEELLKQINDLQTSNKTTKEEFEGKIKSLKLDSAIKLKLKESKAKYEDLLISKFDREKLNLKEDGSIEGLDDQLTSLKEGYKDLFEQPVTGKTPANTGDSKAPTSELDQVADTFKNFLG